MKNKKDVIKKTPYESFSMTQQEVAEAMGVDRGYISILETRAKAKVKAKLEERGFKVEDFFGGMA
jgi:DNA-directed RNA polymerase specialized sigma subunit